MMTGAALWLGLALLRQEPAPATPPAAPAPPVTAAPNGQAPSPDEVDALLKELDRQAKEADTLAAPTPVPAAEPGPAAVGSPGAAVGPPWLDMLVPVLSLRLRPFVLLGHPGAERQPRLRGDARGMVGAEVHPMPGVSARVVLSAHPSVPEMPPLGQDVLLDAWVDWTYAALGGQLSVRAGRQEVELSDLVAASNRWLQRAPRLDGVRMRVGWSRVFAQALGGVEVPAQVGARGVLSEVNGLAALQAGVADGPGRLVELHALMWQRRMPLQGDAAVNAAGPTVMDVGGQAQWHWWGLRGRAALDLQQRHFEPPSIYVPAGAWHLSAGYAPPVAWAMGAYVEAGTRGAWGTPGTWAYGPLGTAPVWGGVRAQEFDPMLSERHGMLGEMDLLGLNNGYGAYVRAGLAREGLRNLAITLWRLSAVNPREAWANALGQTLLRKGEGSPEAGLGWEVDLSATAELTRFIQLSGAVGLLTAEPHARSAGFSAFAQTAWVSLDFQL